MTGDVQCSRCGAWGYAVDEHLNPWGPGCVKCQGRENCRPMLRDEADDLRDELEEQARDDARRRSRVQALQRLLLTRHDRLAMLRTGTRIQSQIN